MVTPATNYFPIKSPSAPEWPKQWHALFTVEQFGTTWLSQSKSTGSFHYDVDVHNLTHHGRSLEYHGKGQHDNWCGCASKTNEDCKILSYVHDPLHYGSSTKPPAATYAVLSKTEKDGTKSPSVCCKLFQGKGQGPLNPTWMAHGNAPYAGTKRAGYPKRECQKRSNPHPGNKFLMTEDLWIIDADGVPCGYVDVFKWWAKAVGFSHSITFNATTYSNTTAGPSTLFDLPTESLECNQPCPNRDDKLKPWCSSTYSWNDATLDVIKALQN